MSVSRKIIARRYKRSNCYNSREYKEGPAMQPDLKSDITDLLQ